MEKKITLKRIFHREKWRIAIFFEFDDKLKTIVRSIPGSAFSITHKCFYVDDTEENLKLILRTLRDIADIDIAALTGSKEESPDSMVPEQITALENISPGIQTTKDEDVEEVHLPKTIHQVAGIKVENTGYHSGYHGRYSPVEFRISEKEGLLVIKFLGMYDPEWIGELRSYGDCQFDKRRKEWLLPWSKMTCDSLADYFTSQGVNVTKQVINEELLSQRKATGDEIRSKHLGKKALDGLDLMGWFLDDNRYSPRTREYLFEGQTSGRYSSESVYRVFKNALLEAGIKKDVGVHSLRHSYATHLHESGLDIRYIQELLGHKSTRTTEIYTHVSRRNLVQVRSPIEDLDVK